MSNVAIIRSMGGLVFDAVFLEEHEATMTITENPVDTGVLISDHAFTNPLSCTIHAGVSDNPLSAPGGDQFSGDSRSRRAYELLTALQQSREPFDVQTGLKLYKNMMCVVIRGAQDVETDSVFIFSASLREVIITYTQAAEVPQRNSLRPSANARQLGRQQVKPVQGANAGTASNAPSSSVASSAGGTIGSSAQATKQQSLAVRLSNYYRGLTQ